MKDLKREYVWWPKMNDDIEKYFLGCYECQSIGANIPETPLNRLATSPEQRVKIQIDWTESPDRNPWLVIADTKTKWIDVYPLESTSSIKIIKCLLDTFSRFALPRWLITDYGKQFSSHEFEEFRLTQGFKHVRTTPYHSISNGFAERAIRTIKDKFSKLSNVRDLKTRLMMTPFWYWKSLQSSTLRSPAELMIGRRLRCTIDNLKPSIERDRDEAFTKQTFIMIKEHKSGNLKSEIRFG
ncbi:Pro-Pol polyprotein [Thelohanellus kitauei]|uniref:Pro-Pol polyprotein n=1 Tax=Thelohanellus kitauei TaxID=669202 RepID=A0A0C2MU45_THEKT|nr:Pro-Pol polyprotein [Thelohanellus kitauei]